MKIIEIVIRTIFFLVLPTFVSLFLVSSLIKTLLPDEKSQCIDITSRLKNNTKIPIINNTNLKQSKCYEFHASSEGILTIDTDTQINLTRPNLKSSTVGGIHKENLLQEGKYSIHIKNIDKKYEISLEIALEDNTQQEQSSKDSVLPINPQINNYIPTKQVSYNPITEPPFQKNEKLQNIVDNIVDTANTRNLPIQSLSISLVDLNSEQCCAYASFQDKLPRYPASVVKLFWLVALFGQYNAGIISPETVSTEKLEKMIKDSDNEASSLILDEITQTKSSQQKLDSEKIKEWIAYRYWVNHFFTSANYPKLNISQKTFPIPYLKIDSPVGPDLQIREIYGKPYTPVRNSLNTYSVARLLYEIDREVAISESYSKKIKELIQRNLQPQFWQNKPYNPIESFLGEKLPPDTLFYSKMGWTFSNRNDAAIIASPNGKVRYILVIFGNNPKFYEDKAFLPDISKVVYQYITDIYESENP